MEYAIESVASADVDAISQARQPVLPQASGLFWCLEPNDCAEPGPYREPVSRHLDPDTQDSLPGWDTSSYVSTTTRPTR